VSDKNLPEIGDRVILTCKNSLSFAGVVTAFGDSPRGEDAVIVELDAASGFSVLCPLHFVDRFREVPIDKR
jgi:hypothetical protein